MKAKESNGNGKNTRIFYKKLTLRCKYPPLKQLEGADAHTSETRGDTGWANICSGKKQAKLMSAGEGTSLREQMPVSCLTLNIYYAQM
jgi:hypothetical protein